MSIWILWFLQNPLPHLVCNDCDLVIQNNYQGELNSGFYMIKPTSAVEKKALELAFQVGKLLNRSVLLPQFNCKDRHPSKRCHLLKAFGAGYLESKQESTYRESVFLQHPKVPELTKLSISPEINPTTFIFNFKKKNSNLSTTISDRIRTNQTLTDFKIIKFSTLIV